MKKSSRPWRSASRSASASRPGQPGNCADRSQSVRTVTSLRPVGSQSRAWRRFSPTAPLIFGAAAITPSSEPYSAIHFAAVFGPTLATPGTLSTVSPISAR